MTNTLRPMNLGEILDRTAQLLRDNFALFVGLAIFPGVLQLAGKIASIHPASIAKPSAAHIALVLLSYGASFVLWAANLLIEAAINASICFAAFRILLSDPVSIRSAFDAGASKAGRFVWLGFLQGLYVGWPLIPVVIVSAAISSAGGSLYWQIPVWVLGLMPSVALYCRYSLAYPAAIIENLGAQAAIQRSNDLSEGGRWRICWGFLLPLAVGTGFVASATYLIEFLKMRIPFLAHTPFVGAGLDGIGSLIAALVFLPVNAIVVTVLYYDQRIRHEGYDIERMMAAAGLNAPADQPAEVTPSQQI